MNNEQMIRRVLGSESHSKGVVAGALLDILEKAESTEEQKSLLAIALVERESVKKQPYALEEKDILA